MTDDLFELDLDLDLHALAAHLHLPPGDVDTVIDRGHRRARRQRRLVSIAAAVALLGATAGTVHLVGGQDPGSEFATDAPLMRGDVPMTWRRVTPSSALGMARVEGSAAPLYAVSTAPGQASIDARTPRVVWRSDDGVEWSAVSTVGDDLYLADLTRAGGRIYAVGTAPATAAPGGGRKAAAPLRVGWSDDGTRSWSSTNLPVDMAAIGRASTAGGIAGTAVAIGRDTVVAVAGLYSELDVPALLPPGTTAPNGWAITASGVDVLGPRTGPACQGDRADKTRDNGEVAVAYCATKDGRTVQKVTPQEAQGVVASYTWRELGVSGDLLDAVRRKTVAFVAPAGGTSFERVELPDVGWTSGAPVLLADDDGFTLVTSATRGGPEGDWRPVVLRSADGRSWTRAGDLPGGVAWIAGAGRVAGRTMMVGDGPDGAVLLRDDGAGGWVATPLAAVVDDLPAGDVPRVASQVGIGRAGIAVAVTLLPRDELASARVPLRQVVLVSRDGATWSQQSLDALVGVEQASVLRTLVTDDRVLVAASVPGDREGAPRRQVVVVGTPQ